MNAIHPFCFEIKDINVLSCRFLKCGKIMSHCVGKYKICNINSKLIGNLSCEE